MSVANRNLKRFRSRRESDNLTEDIANQNQDDYEFFNNDQDILPLPGFADQQQIQSTKNHRSPSVQTQLVEALNAQLQEQENQKGNKISQIELKDTLNRTDLNDRVINDQVDNSLEQMIKGSNKKGNALTRLSNQKLLASPASNFGGKTKAGGKKLGFKIQDTYSVISGPKSLNPNVTLDMLQMADLQTKFKDQLEKDQLLAQNEAQMKRLLATEQIIDKVILLLDTNPFDDLGNWPADAEKYKGMKLSESKMLNEVNHREPRTKSAEGKFTEYSFFSTDFGYHSTERKNRKMEAEELGEGTNLYFKLMKYFMCVFFMATLLSGPALTFYIWGMEYDLAYDQYNHYVAISTIGNLGSFQTQSCAQANLPPTLNAASYIGFTCPNGKYIKSLDQFGLAFQNQSCTGWGIQKSVQTINRCSLGSQSNIQRDQNILQQFQTSCVGQKVCSMYLNYKNIFSDECNLILASRQNGSTFYGPAQVYAVAVCQTDNVKLGNLVNIPIEYASIIVICLDCITIIFIAICIIRLKWYENVAVQDMKHGRLILEDFAVTVPNIPLDINDYSNNPNLLTAMLTVHLEEIVGHELQCIPELEQIQTNQKQIVSIYYGLKSQTTMSYLVRIINECELIANLRKKIQVDPKNTKDYEAQIWKHYTNITYLNDQYHEERSVIQPEIRNAFIVFRSMEGQKRAIQAYDINALQRFSVDWCCCLGQFFTKKMILQKGYPRVDQAVDPNIIIWENIGINWTNKCSYVTRFSFIIIFFLIASYWGHYYGYSLHKDIQSYQKSDCTGESFYDIDKAWTDSQLPIQFQLGYINCYCLQEFKLYGQASLNIFFGDGQQYCQQWYLSWSYVRFLPPALGVWIACFNVILTITCQIMSQFMKPHDNAEGFTTSSILIFISQYINTAVVILFANNSFTYTFQQRQQASKQSILPGIYDEFDSNWYYIIGSAIIFQQGAMLVLPHIFTIFQGLFLWCTRCFDRTFSFNTKKTLKIIQSEYEDLYTGPKFILEVRYAQVLASIFVTITFSSGIPGLYALNLVILFLQYWIDKWLIFNYYRKTPEFTKHLSNRIVDLMPYAIFIHILFAYFTFSYPFILNSRQLRPFFGNYSQYFSYSRIGQIHIIIFLSFSCLVALIFMFESFLVKCWRSCTARCIYKCGSCLAKMNGREYDGIDFQSQGFVYSDDIYYEINFDQLYKLFRNCEKDRQIYRTEKSEGVYNQKEIKYYIDPYLELLDRNYLSLKKRILELIDIHEDYILGDIDFEDMTEDQKIEGLLELYKLGSDKNNAQKQKYSQQLDPQMHGRFINELQSYDYLDNEKYKKIEKLMEILQDTFGFLSNLEKLRQKEEDEKLKL